MATGYEQGLTTLMPYRALEDLPKLDHRI